MSKKEDNLKQRTLLLTYAREADFSFDESQVFRLLAKSNDKELSASKLPEIVKSNKKNILRQLKEINILPSLLALRQKSRIVLIYGKLFYKHSNVYLSRIWDWLIYFATLQKTKNQVCAYIVNKIYL